MYFLIINFFELLAAIIGTIYLKRAKYRENKLTRYFVWFLWLTVFVELVFGRITWLIYEIESLAYLKDSFLGNTHWVYNVYFIVCALFYAFYFKENTDSKKGSFFLNIGMLLYSVLSVSDLIFTDIYFSGVSSVVHVLGSILIFLSVMLYFYKILQSDKILSFHKEFPFYIAIGAMTLHLVVTPLFIYGEYISKKNIEFIEVRWVILTAANIFMYTCYTIGFIVCSRENRSY